MIYSATNGMHRTITEKVIPHIKYTTATLGMILFVFWAGMIWYAASHHLLPGTNDPTITKSQGSQSASDAKNTSNKTSDKTASKPAGSTSASASAQGSGSAAAGTTGGTTGGTAAATGNLPVSTSSVPQTGLTGGMGGGAASIPSGTPSTPSLSAPSTTTVNVPVPTPPLPVSGVTCVDQPSTVTIGLDGKPVASATCN